MDIRTCFVIGMLLINCPVLADEYVLNLITDGNIEYYDKHSCDDNSGIQVKEKDGRLVMISFAIDGETGKKTNELNFGCQLKLKDIRQSNSAIYTGKCKHPPTATCPTCTSANIHLSFVTFSDRMAISSVSSMPYELSGLYKICRK